MLARDVVDLGGERLAHAEGSGGPSARETSDLSFVSLLTTPRAMLGLAGVFVASRGLGLLREVGVAFYFGTSTTADNWAAAFVVISLASVFTGEASYAAGVRWLGQHSHSDRASAYAELLRQAVRVAFVVMATLAIAGPFFTLLVLGDPIAWSEPALLSLLLIPSVGANVIASSVNAELTLQRRFVLINGVQMLYSAGAVMGLLVISIDGVSAEPMPIAIGWTAGNVAALLVLYLKARPATPTRLRAKAATLSISRIGGPIALAYALVALQGLTDQGVAARLGSGNVAALGYADRLFLIPVGFVIAALGPMVLGTLTSAQMNTPSSLARTALRQLKLMAQVLAPASLLFAAISPVLVRWVFDYGAFTTRSLQGTNAALDGLVLGISAVGVSLLLFRGMQAVAALPSLAVIALGMACLNVALSITLGTWLDLFGVTLATSLVALITIFIQLVFLGRTVFGDAWTKAALRAVAVPAVITSCASASLIAAHRMEFISDLTRVLLGAAMAGVAGLVILVQSGRE